MKRRLLNKEDGSDPMSVVSNLFDVAMVFAVALMVALVSRYNMTEMFSKEDFTMVKNPGKEDMEIITKEGEKINRYTPSENQDPKSGKKGKKEGQARRHRLRTGKRRNHLRAGVIHVCKSFNASPFFIYMMIAAKEGFCIKKLSVKFR